MAAVAVEVEERPQDAVSEQEDERQSVAREVGGVDAGNVADAADATDTAAMAEAAGVSDVDAIPGIPLYRKYRWLRIFRFNLNNFRPGNDVALRHFSIVEAMALLITAYLASRGLGLVRQTLFNALFGTGPEAAAYLAAARVPETLFDLVTSGALSNALIPIFVSHERNRGEREVWRLASLVLNLLLVILTIVVLIGEFIAPTFVSRLLVPGYSAAEQAKVIALTRIMLLQPLILGTGTVAGAVLSSKRQFLLPALAIAVYNLGIIGGLLVSLAVPGVGIYGPTCGVLAAAALQALVQGFGLFKEGFRYSFVWDVRAPGLWEALRMLGPNALSVTIASFAVVLDTAFISYYPDRNSLAAQHNAHLLFTLPVTLVGIVIAQAALPQMSLHAAKGRYLRLRQTILAVVGGSVLVSIPCALFLYLFGRPIIRILFQHGAFTHHATMLTSLALIGYAVGLPGQVAGQLLTRSLYSLKDTFTPLCTNILMLAARIGLTIVFIRILTGKYLILAIPLALSIAATAEALLLALLLFNRLRKKIRLDKGLLRLQARRAGAKAV
jgi:putative peptidoglycan lipid II flippase